jgi:hypothetical protein
MTIPSGGYTNALNRGDMAGNRNFSAIIQATVKPDTKKKLIKILQKDPRYQGLNYTVTTGKNTFRFQSKDSSSTEFYIQMLSNDLRKEGYSFNFSSLVNFATRLERNIMDLVSSHAKIEDVPLRKLIEQSSNNKIFAEMEEGYYRKVTLLYSSAGEDIERFFSSIRGTSEPIFKEDNDDDHVQVFRIGMDYHVFQFNNTDNSRSHLTSMFWLDLTNFTVGGYRNISNSIRDLTKYFSRYSDLVTFEKKRVSDYIVGDQLPRDLASSKLIFEVQRFPFNLMTQVVLPYDSYPRLHSKVLNLIKHLGTEASDGIIYKGTHGDIDSFVARVGKGIIVASVGSDKKMGVRIIQPRFLARTKIGNYHFAIKPLNTEKKFWALGNNQEVTIGNHNSIIDSKSFFYGKVRTATEEAVERLEDNLIVSKEVLIDFVNLSFRKAIEDRVDEIRDQLGSKVYSDQTLPEGIHLTVIGSSKTVLSLTINSSERISAPSTLRMYMGVRFESFVGPSGEQLNELINDALSSSKVDDLPIKEVLYGIRRLLKGNPKFEIISVYFDSVKSKRCILMESHSKRNKSILGVEALLQQIGAKLLFDGDSSAYSFGPFLFVFITLKDQSKVMYFVQPRSILIGR